MNEIEKLVITPNNPEMVYIMLSVILVTFIACEIIQVFVIKAKKERLLRLKKKLKKYRRHK